VLPKGTILFANTWSIHRTGEYANPDEFIPERFLDSEYGIAAESTEDEKEGMRRPLYGFGAGRRACSGQRLAENSLVSPHAYTNLVQTAFETIIIPGTGN
jgi:cytochrome P450